MVCIKDRFAICLFVCFKGSAMVCLLPDKSNLYLQCSPSVGIAKCDLEYKISPLAPSKSSRHLNLITGNSLVSNSKLCTLWFLLKTDLQFVLQKILKPWMFTLFCRLICTSLVFLGALEHRLSKLSSNQNAQ